MDGAELHGDDERQRGRAAFDRRLWTDAFKAFAAADAAGELELEDRDRLAWSAFLIGRFDDFVRAMERVHQGHQAAQDPKGAARCALWLGFALANRGEIGPAMGWFARAERLLARADEDSAERGILLLRDVFQHAMTGSWDAVVDVADQAAAIGERFAEADLSAVALHWKGRALLRLGRVSDGMALLDETMVPVTCGELSPFVTGVIYCSVIEACQEIYDLQRLREWTAALGRWCDGQPDLVPFSGFCFVHRAELLVRQGLWDDALAEARRAHELIEHGGDQLSGAAALYQQGEILRGLGDLAGAEEAYRQASELGWDPQPGLALLRLELGDGEAAAAAIRRRVGEVPDPLERARFLPAAVEIMLATGDAAAATRACDELDDVAARWSSPVVAAMAAGARGAVMVAEGNASAALTLLRQAVTVWQRVDAPYEVARLRLLIGSCCAALGDHDTAGMERSAARAVFERLGLARDVARVDALSSSTPADSHGLTDRELEVLRRVASGDTNKAIAAALCVSEKTVDRHVSNMFTKLGVASRTAATAYAYQHHLV